MPKLRHIPFSAMQDISHTGVFIKQFSRHGKVAMKSYAHRDDYYVVALITEGAAAVEIDFEKKYLEAGEMFIISPWQVHNRPSEEEWAADGWVIALSPEFLSEKDTRLIEEYSISPTPLKPGEEIFNDVNSLCAMMMKHKENIGILMSLACAFKSMVLSTLAGTNHNVVGRYKAITVRLRKLLDRHLAEEKSPSAYASMLNISEVYLNEAVKGTTGLCVGAYIRSCVMTQARRQLVYTALSSKEIAFALGYDDYAYFSKLFKKHCGTSPSEFRKNLK